MLIMKNGGDIHGRRKVYVNAVFSECNPWAY